MRISAHVTRQIFVQSPQKPWQYKPKHTDFWQFSTFNRKKCSGKNNPAGNTFARADPISLLILLLFFLCFLFGRRSSTISLRLHLFKSDQDEIWQLCCLFMCSLKRIERQSRISGKTSYFQDGGHDVCPPLAACRLPAWRHKLAVCAILDPCRVPGCLRAETETKYQSVPTRSDVSTQRCEGGPQ